MAYSADSLSGQKGDLGELIVKKHYEKLGFSVEKPQDTFFSGASVVDFVAKKNDTAQFFIEVKTRQHFPYGIEQAPCYALPKQHVAAYLDYAESGNVPLILIFVDPIYGAILAQDIKILEQQKRIDFRIFPEEKFSDYFGGYIHYWHKLQFVEIAKINEPDLSQLRFLFKIESKHNGNKAIYGDKLPVVVDILVAPNGTLIDFVKHPSSPKIKIKVARLTSALGYGDSSKQGRFQIREAAKLVNIYLENLPVQRLSGGINYGKTAYYLNAEDCPKILAQFCELKKRRCKNSLQQAQLYQNAITLRNWFLSDTVNKILTQSTN